MRKCDTCGLEAKTIEELDGVFRKAKTCKHGYQNRCLDCERDRQNTKHYRSREGRRESEIRLRYNIELSEYEACMATSNVCQICGSADNLCYDHCHDTNKFRGVLCKKCNTGLGMFGDSQALLSKATMYLTQDVGDIIQRSL